eukprot:9345209-Heterocapsa_arctica.AAC.1
MLQASRGNVDAAPLVAAPDTPPVPEGCITPVPVPPTPVAGLPPGGVYYDSSPANSVDSLDESGGDQFPAFLREFCPDEESAVPALCCRLGIAGIFKGPDVAVN